MKIDGLTLEDIKQIDVRKLDARALQAIVQKLVDAGNKRIKRLEKTGLAKNSPAYQYLRTGKKHKGKVQRFTGKVAKPKSKAEKKLYSQSKGAYKRAKLLREYSRASKFLFESKTGGIKGLRSVMKQMESRFAGYGELTKAQRQDFWEAYNRLLNSPEGALIQKKGAEGGVMTSSEAQRVLYSEMYGEDSASADDVIANMREALGEAYEERRARESEAEEENALDLSLGDDEEDWDW